MIRFGMIGTNKIADEFVKAAAAVDNVRIAAVYSRLNDTAASFAHKHAIARTYTDLDTFASDPELDAIYIATPNIVHAPQAMLFLRHGKHVLCEKPITTNVRELQQLIAAAKQHGVLLMEAMKPACLPAMAELRSLIESIGPVRRAVFSYCQYSSRYDAFKRGEVMNAFKPELGNGSLMDIGVYCVHPLVALFGAPANIHAKGYTLSTGVDGSGLLTLSYPEMDALISHSKITDSYLPSEIQGEQGTILIDRISTPQQLVLHLRGKEPQILDYTCELPIMAYEIQHFANSVEQGLTEAPLVPHAVSLETTRIMQEARRQIGLVYPRD
ncbi:Gfo/Idh/MocA family protein [Paenibacillus marinisediminis]